MRKWFEKDIELTPGQLILVIIGTIALSVPAYLWLSGALWQHGIPRA